ncbi:PilN domain-containing protein [Cellulomonas sp. KRMCY2]|uniref:PilN domain-containing protein n=1 Tax=Cellulomonas sp. KRMCY2 TaxID=1304865 RepID=UPI00045EA608|nr:PilN domain-containing protein [Cellulomonas sp. KRMCY2]
MSPKSTRAAEAFPDGRVDYAGLGAALRPQVNLLPPEIRNRRSLGRVKVRLGLALLIVLLIAAVAFVYAAFTEKAAAEELATTQRQVADLAAQQEEFAEVPRVKSQIDAVATARDLTMATEVLWTEYLRSVQAVTPESVRITTFSTAMPGPLQAPITSTSPLDAVSVGSVSLTGNAATLPDLATWMDALDAIPGLADPTYTTAELTDDDGVISYSIAVTVQVDDNAYALRFVPKEGS